MRKTTPRIELNGIGKLNNIDRKSLHVIENFYFLPFKNFFTESTRRQKAKISSAYSSPFILFANKDIRYKGQSNINVNIPDPTR